MNYLYLAQHKGYNIYGDAVIINNNKLIQDKNMDINKEIV
jgi:hypothetical protein